MSFCSYCGAQIPDGTKFCPECGQKVAAAPEEPAQPAYEAPQQTYTPPAQQSYEAPQQTYTPPAQSYTPPAQTYAPPTQSGGGSYVPPAAPPAAPKQKKGGGKKLGLIIGIAAAVVALVVALVLLLGGKGGKDDPLLGRYEATSCVIGNVDVGADGEWIELKAKNKAEINIMGESFKGTWELDGEAFTFEQSGDKFEGTLKNGVLTLDIEGMRFTFEKEGGAASTPGKNDKTDKNDKSAAAAGYWTLLRSDSDDPDSAMSEEDVAMFKEYGIEFFLNLKEDGTGVTMLDAPAHVTWANGVITAEDGTTIPYEVKNDQLQFDLYGCTNIFVRGEGSAPEIDWDAYAEGGDDWDDWDDGDDSEDGNEKLGMYYWWEGRWYGWLVFSNASEYYSDWIGSFGDCIVDITVNDDDTGYVEISWLDGEVFAWANVTFGAGTTVNGCMMSEDGSMMDFDIEYADWIVDPGVSAVSEFDNMIQIDGTLYDADYDWVDYDFYLRPWGMDWEDVRNADTSNMPYDDMMPLEYDTWYLPQLTA